MKAWIVQGQNTAGHGAKLRELGYTVTEGKRSVVVRKKGQSAKIVEKATFEIECEGFMNDKGGYDLVQDPKFFARLVKEKKLINYGTRVRVRPGEEQIFNRTLCRELGALSCLIAHNGEDKEEAVTRPPVSIDLDA